MLARDPTYMFDSELFSSQGNLFWSDIYHEGMVQDEAYSYVGEWGVCVCVHAWGGLGMAQGAGCAFSWSDIYHEGMVQDEAYSSGLLLRG